LVKTKKSDKKNSTEKTRVYEIAREFNLSSEALIKILSELSIVVKSHMSALTDSQIVSVRKKFEEEKAKAKTQTAKKSLKRRKKKKKKVIRAEAKKKVKTTLAKMDSQTGKKRKKDKRRYKEEKQEKHLEKNLELEKVRAEEAGTVKITEYTTPSELSDLMGITLNEVIGKCLELGVMATANQRLDAETIAIIAEEFGFKVETVGRYGAEELEDARMDSGGKKQDRPPIVTVMGHVDHGKTALLDRIRMANVIESESGGITQHIGAYVTELPGGMKITFIDTPGHEAFTAMRMRGAQITDIVILVVAADSRVMPQTLEAIDHARSADVPIIVAITKTDLSTANTDFIKQDLASNNVLIEDWGGDILCSEVSALKNENMNDLLEKILLQAEMMELKGCPDRLARGTILEGSIDQRRGIVVNVIIEDGTLNKGDHFIAGYTGGRVKAIFDGHDKELDSIGPGYPAQILGCNDVPVTGESIIVVESERKVRDVTRRRKIVQRERELHALKKVTLEDFRAFATGERSTLNLVVRADVQGTAEAIEDMLLKLRSDEVDVKIVHKGVGGITETDVNLAVASSAVIIGFRVRPDIRARESAKENNIEIAIFSVIHKVEETVKQALSGLLKPTETEDFLGSAEVRDTFKVPKVGIIAGSYVIAGIIRRNARVRLVRDGVELWSGKVSSLKHLKDDKREIKSGYECGIGLEGFNDIKPGDVIESFEIVFIKRELD